MRIQFLILFGLFTLVDIVFSTASKTLEDNEEEQIQSMINTESPDKGLNRLNEFKGKAIRGGSRGSGSGVRISGGSSSGIRTSSNTRYSNTRTGVRISRPPGSQWVRTLGFFLPISRRFLHRSRSSSNRYTTSSTDPNSYYYCTSTDNPNNEIQCYSKDGDDQCCEDSNSNQPFCCGGSTPNYIVADPNRAVKILARVFYTLAAVAFCMHLFMRRLYR